MIPTSKPNSPSPSWISSIILKPVEGGVNNGILSYHITFSGVDPVDRCGAVADLVLKILQSEYKIKCITLQGTFPSEDLMLMVVKSFKDIKDSNNLSVYRVGAVTDGEAYHYWWGTSANRSDRLLDWITLDLHRVNYPGFAVEEVIYHLTSVSDPMPILPSNCRALYLSPGELPVEDVMKFIRNSKLTWGICSPAERKYEVKIL